MRMLMFDEDFRILGEGLRGGVNLNSTSEPDACANIRQCLEEIFANGIPPVIDKLYYVFVGQADMFLDALNGLTTVKETIAMSEPEAGLLAGALWRSGFVALAGTGSDVFLISEGRVPKVTIPDSRYIGNAFEAHTLRTVVGAWGPILGDDASGSWIGQQAIRRAITGLEGWSEPTAILDMIREEWQLGQYWDMVETVYRSQAPFRKVASLTGIVGRAASGGDKVACDILKEAGRLMATQTLCLAGRFDVPAGDLRLVTCGGAWKSHPLMFRTFQSELALSRPDIQARLHGFEHIMAGPAREMLEQSETRAGGARISGEQAASLEKRMAELFPAYVIHWSIDEI